MRFRLFRSRAFWFGVPGLVFLLWAWGVSKGHRTYVLAASDVAELLVGQLDGRVIFVRGPGPLPPLEEWRLVHSKLAPGEAEEIFKETSDDVESGLASAVIVPHILLVAGYGLAWVALVEWRRRKYRGGIAKMPAG